MTSEILYDGIDNPPAEPLRLRAGPLEMIFEPDAAFLRYLSLGDTEILRGIYSAVRDHNWDTIAASISDVKLESTPETFRLTFRATHREREVDFAWDGVITGDGDGTVRFVMDGRAGTTFRRNRIGFCVLHPIGCAGEGCELEHADGSRERSAFPDTIAPQPYVEGRPRPHKPFVNLEAMRHEVMPGLSVRVGFEGELFEMEDQRNWTDASYKTYCTPLERPFPVEVAAGERIRQTVTVALEGAVPAVRRGRAQPVTFTVDSQSLPGLPDIGLGIASHGEPLSPREVERLRPLVLSHLRVDLELSDPAFAKVFEEAESQARALGAALEVAGHVTDDAERELRDLAATLGTRRGVARWLVFHQDEKSTSQRWLKLAKEHLGTAGNGAMVFGGANAYFAEINRARPPAEALDGVCYSVNPQVHAFDNASLVESLKAQGETVRTAQTFAGGRPVAVTPVTLKPRFNPNATGPEPEPPLGELPPQVDVRQLSLFGAGWTLGSIKYLSESGASSVTYYETTGWRGVMERESGSPLPDRFPSPAGAVFLLYHVFADVAEFKGAQVLTSRSTNPLALEGLALAKDGRTRVLVANLTPEFTPVRIDLGAGTRFLRVKKLTVDNADAAMREPERFRRDPGLLCETGGGALELSLAPYALARIDSAEEETS